MYLRKKRMEHLRSESGIELVSEDDVVDVMVLSEPPADNGPRGPCPPPPGYPPPPPLRTASVWAIQAEGSMGRTGSWRGIVK